MLKDCNEIMYIALKGLHPEQKEMYFKLVKREGKTMAEFVKDYLDRCVVELGGSDNEILRKKFKYLEFKG